MIKLRITSDGTFRGLWDDDRINCLIKSQPVVWRLRLRHDRRTQVLVQVAFRLDWSLFLSCQNDRTRRIISMVVAGHHLREVAERFGVTESALCQRLSRVSREWGLLSSVDHRMRWRTISPVAR